MSADRTTALLRAKYGVPEAPESTSVSKAESRTALLVVLSPNTVDIHGHTYTAREIEKACNSFNVHCLQDAGGTADAQILQSYIALSAFEHEGRMIAKGTWLQKWEFQTQKLEKPSGKPARLET